MDVSIDLTISLQGYFKPYDYTGMDPADRYLRSGGVALLDFTILSKGTNDVKIVTINKDQQVRHIVCGIPSFLPNDLRPL